VRRMVPARLLIAFFVAVPTTSLAVTLSFAGPASAKAGSVTCKHLSGDPLTTSLTGCSHAASTGGSGTFLMTDSATITWANGKTTSTSLGASQATIDETERYSCPAGSTEFVFSGIVFADTTGSIAIGSALSVEICLIPTSIVVNEKGSKLRV